MTDIVNQLVSRVREHINDRTMMARLGELESCEVAIEVLEELQSEYEMRRDELRSE